MGIFTIILAGLDMKIRSTAHQIKGLILGFLHHRLGRRPLSITRPPSTPSWTICANARKKSGSPRAGQLPPAGTRRGDAIQPVNLLGGIPYVRNDLHPATIRLPHGFLIIEGIVVGGEAIFPG